MSAPSASATPPSPFPTCRGEGRQFHDAICGKCAVSSFYVDTLVHLIYKIRMKLDARFLKRHCRGRMPWRGRSIRFLIVFGGLGLGSVRPVTQSSLAGDFSSTLEGSRCSTTLGSVFLESQRDSIHEAQGCEERATLGVKRNRINPEWVAPSAVPDNSTLFHLIRDNSTSKSSQPVGTKDSSSMGSHRDSRQNFFSDRFHFSICA